MRYQWLACYSTCIWNYRTQRVCAGDIAKKANRPLLPAQSSHPKSLKDGLVNLLFISALHRSCAHLVSCSISKVEKRLLVEGFSVNCLHGVMTRIPWNFIMVNARKSETHEKFVVISFFHISHNLRNMGVGNSVWRCVPESFQAFKTHTFLMPHWW